MEDSNSVHRPEMNSELIPAVILTNTLPSPTTGLMQPQPSNSLPSDVRMSSNPPYPSQDRSDAMGIQHFQGENQGGRSNFLHPQLNQKDWSRSVESSNSTLLYACTGLLQPQACNLLSSDVRMSSNPLYPGQDRSDAMGIQHFQGENQGDRSNFLHPQQNQTEFMQYQPNDLLPSEARMSSNPPYPYQLEEYQASGNMGAVGFLPSQPNQVGQNQIDPRMPSQLNQTPRKKRSTSQASLQPSGKVRTAEAERSWVNREKKKETMKTLQNENQKTTENERELTEKVENLTAERTNLMNEIGNLKTEKIEWKKEKEELTSNVRKLTEYFRKLSAQYEALSQSISYRQPDVQTTTQSRESEFQKIHQKIDQVLKTVLEGKIDMLATSKNLILAMDGFRHSNEKISTQNRQSDITSTRTGCNPEDTLIADQSQQASTSCLQPNAAIQAQAKQPTVEQFHPSNCSALQQPALGSFQTTQDGSHISSGVQDPQRTESISNGGGVVNTSHLTKNQENPRAELLDKVNEKRKSNAKFSDFPDLVLDQDERVNVGEYNLPKSLQTTAQEIMDKYGDITEQSIMHTEVNERTFILFCASMKEMADLQLDDVTEDHILKWSDTIMTALAMHFDVEFAMHQLKENIVPFYIDRIKLEFSLVDLKQKYAKRYEQSML